MKERLVLLAQALNMTPSRFSRSIGKSESYLRTISGNPGIDVLISIIRCYPRVNLIWLLIGDGHMFNEQMEENNLGYDSKHDSISIVQEDSPTYGLEVERTIRRLEEKMNSMQEMIDLLKTKVETRDEIIDLLKMRLENQEKNNI